jgi:hypothetical protein
MAYRTGAQGPQSASGAQGPTLQDGALWGSQGPVDAKRPPFSINGSGLSLTGTLLLMLTYQHVNGKKFAIFVERDVPEDADLLSVLPDDVVQFVNLIDFRPQQGVYHTLAGGTVNYYVVEITGVSLIDKLKSLVNLDDQDTSPIYTQPEVGL